MVSTWSLIVVSVEARYQARDDSHLDEEDDGMKKGLRKGKPS